MIFTCFELIAQTDKTVCPAINIDGKSNILIIIVMVIIFSFALIIIFADGGELNKIADHAG